MILQSRLESFRRRSISPPDSLHDLEYSVFSQFGDDGIIEYLATRLPKAYRTFVEFGVEDYSESNTRLLLQRDNWSGLVFDGSEKNIHSITSSSYFWKHDLKAVHAFITCENINHLLESNGLQRTVGILHIDIDGVDFWVWKAIQVIQPLLIIVEYNALFGSTEPVSVPYDPMFFRFDMHHSGLYAGASLPAFLHLANERSYNFLGSNSAGNNAYFLHRSIESPVPIATIESGYVKSKFREARDGKGNLTLRPPQECFAMLGELPLINVATGTELKCSQLREDD